MKRKQYTAEFKQQMVKETLRIGNVAQVAREHDLPAQLLYRWKKEATMVKSMPSFGQDASSFATIQMLKEDHARLQNVVRELHKEITEIKAQQKKMNVIAFKSQVEDTMPFPSENTTNSLNTFMGKISRNETKTPPGPVSPPSTSGSHNSKGFSKRNWNHQESYKS